MKTTAIKILAMVLALSMVFALCACGQNSATESSKPAEVKGRRLGHRAYQFLKEPLIARFGQDWYDELCLTAQEYLRQYPAD